MFADTIKDLPFTPTTPNGSGFLPPIFRASMHILFLLACHADDRVEVTDQNALDWLGEAQEHWNARLITPAVSTVTLGKANTIAKAIGEAMAEYTAWNADTRTTNLRELSQRIAQYAADLDREFTGHRDSDPGTSL